MNAVLLKIIPLLIAFAVGFGLRKADLLSRQHADRLLKLVINIGLPVLILISIGNLHLDASLSLLAVYAGIIIFTAWPVATAVGHWLQLPKATLGVFIIGPMALNLSIVYPFVMAAWGTEGFAYLALFDFGNGLLMFTLVYALSCWYGAERTHWLVVLKRIALFPPFIALFTAIILNLTNVGIPDIVVNTLRWVGQIILLLVPLALGIYLDTRHLFSRAALLAVLLRAGLGLLIALLLIEVFQLEGLMRIIVLVGAVAPVGFNVLVFATRHHLDREFAASIASTSLILALIYLPVLSYYL